MVAGFDGGALTADAGGLLLGAADRRLDLVRRLAGCFRDATDPRFVEHSVATLVGQRVLGIALGYEDLNDHDELRHDPLMAVLAGKLEAWRSDCAPAAGKSTLNRLELSRETPTKYRKIAHDEDLSRVRKGHGAQNMALIRKFAFNKLRTAPPFGDPPLTRIRSPGPRCGIVRLNSSQRYLKFQDGDATRCVGYPRMVETRRVWRSE